ncbi:MAG TPA: PAS domain S-box protein [Ferrovibrio sp.]|uniref:PAS domain-containing sensor histidine kinase n=1 Tax=Ferrovibrio sp. TaxID=1917215 RepID=UPI002B4B4F4F|nr:PAS domain S-box protein [Ferrovibrio sp.]HLT76809.1 PAS domain S-box protein [Ferrovibrio sp.]
MRRLTRPNIWIGCAIGILGVGVGTALQLLVEPVLGDRAAFLFFIPAVAAAAAVAGLVPGALIGLLALIVGMVLVTRRAPADLPDIANAALYVFVAGIIVAGGEWLQRARRWAVRVNRDLEQGQAHLQLVLDTMPDAMIEIDERGLIRSFNPAAERLFGWTKSEVEGRNVNMLMPSPHREAHDGYLERYYRTGERRVIGQGRLVVGLRRDGSTFPLELAVGEITTRNGRFFTGFVRDLSERQKAETRLQELQSELIHISRVTAMGEMASALAHELNQPLSAIANYLRGSGRLLMQDTVPRERLSEALEKATEQALRAGQIIRRLRDFLARGEAEPRVESLQKLVEEAGALALLGAQDHGVNVRYRFAPGADLVLADRVQIQQVLVNLIRNAVDAMMDSPRRDLEISTTMTQPGWVEVAISDTGPGISRDIADQLFQPFVTTKPQGMGVGLSISRTIVEAHGGRIAAEETPGGGTTFRFTLKAAGTEEAAHD